MFSLVEPLLRFISLPPIKVENILLVCHYRVTPVYMLLVAIILTSKVTLVDNINCHPRYGSSTDISVNTLQVHCYYNHDSHSGVPPFYQFLPLLFFISALGFTAPKVIYQMFEKSIFEEIIGDLSKPFKVKHDFKPVSQAFTAWLCRRQTGTERQDCHDCRRPRRTLSSHAVDRRCRSASRCPPRRCLGK